MPQSNEINNSTGTENYIKVLGIAKVKQLITDYANLLPQENQIIDLLDNYILAQQNPTDKKIFSFLFSLNNINLIYDLINYEFLPIADNQKKKTEFLRCVNHEKAKIKNNTRHNSIDNSITNGFCGYEKSPLSKFIVQCILSEFSINVRLNQAINKIEIKDIGNYLSIYSQENRLSILPSIILDHCKENGVTGLSQGIKLINTYLFSIADENRYNPITDMLSQFENNDKTNLENLYSILGISNDTYKTYLKKWLIQTVALAHNTAENPVSAEGVLVLQGSQAKGKTSFFRKLAGNQQWFIEGASLDMKNKDSIINALSGWICELGELDSTINHKQSSLKAFITQSKDSIRLPYAPVATDKPRTTSFCGTVNDERFLTDNTGNRRYWVIPIDNIDKVKLNSLTKEDVFKVWGYIETLYKEDPNSFRLSDEELHILNNKNNQYQSEIKFQQEVLYLLDFERDLDYWDYYFPSEISECLRNLNLCNCNAKQIGKVLTYLCNNDPRIDKRRCSKGFQYLLPVNKTTLEHALIPRSKH